MGVGNYSPNQPYLLPIFSHSNKFFLINFHIAMIWELKTRKIICLFFLIFLILIFSKHVSFENSIILRHNQDYSQFFSFISVLCHIFLFGIIVTSRKELTVFQLPSFLNFKFIYLIIKHLLFVSINK